MIGPFEIWPGIALLRPAWLLLLPLAVLLCWRLPPRFPFSQRNRPAPDSGDGGDGGPWQGVVDAHLLPHLLLPDAGALPDAHAGDARKHGALLACLVLCLGLFALAGPALRHDDDKAVLLRPATTRLLLVDLSPAFAALPAAVQEKMRLKLRALLDAQPRVETALAVHDGNAAYLVVPPTTDTASVARWLPDLQAAAMPAAASGKGYDDARRLASEVFAHRADGPRRELIWFTPASLAAAAIILPDGIETTIVKVGADAAPPTPAATAPAPRSAGRSTRLLVLQDDDSDLRALNSEAKAEEEEESESESAGKPGVPQVDFLRGAGRRDAVRMTRPIATAAGWNDGGPLLLLILLPFAALLLATTRRLAMVATLATAAFFGLPLAGVSSSPATAADADAASGDARWQAVARYRAGDFAGAAALLEPHSDADSLYNRGNALARLGRLEDALGLYEAALASRPGDADFRHNRDLLAKLVTPPPSSPPPPASTTPPAANVSPTPPRPPNTAPPARSRQEEIETQESRESREAREAREARRIAEQWLRRVPDVPASEAGKLASGAAGNLLARKLALEAARRVGEQARAGGPR